MLRRFAPNSIRGVSAVRWFIAALRVGAMQRPIGMNRASGLWLDKGVSIDNAAKGALCIFGVYAWYRYLEETKALEDRKDSYTRAPLQAQKALDEGVSKTGIEAIRHLRRVAMQYCEASGALEDQKDLSNILFDLLEAAHHAFEAEIGEPVAVAYTHIHRHIQDAPITDDPSERLHTLLQVYLEIVRLYAKTQIYCEIALRERLARIMAFKKKIEKECSEFDAMSWPKVQKEDLLDLAERIGPEGIRILTQTRQQVLNVMSDDRKMKSENRKEVDKLLQECADRLQKLSQVTCKLATDDDQLTNKQIEPGPNEQSTHNSTTTGARDERHDNPRKVKS